MDDIQNESQTFDFQSKSESAPENETPNTEATDDQGGGDVSQEPKIVFDEAQQGKVNSLIGEKVAKTHEATRRAEAAEARLALYESQQPKPKAPDVPDMPDPDDFYGDDAGYQAKISERDAAIEKRAEFNAEQRMAETQSTAQAQQQANEVAHKQQETDKSYVKNAESFGINLEQAQKDGAVVSQAGLSPDIQDHIHGDAQGPLITNFLASNILELDKIRSMTPLNAAIHIANEIKPKLAGIKKTTKTPAPNSVIDGSTISDTTPKSLEGVTYR